MPAHQENRMNIQAIPATTDAPPTSAPTRTEAGPCMHRTTRRLSLAPRFAAGRRTVDVRYLWAGAAGAPTVIVQGGISAGRGVCAIDGVSGTGWWDDLVG